MMALFCDDGFGGGGGGNERRRSHLVQVYEILRQRDGGDNNNDDNDGGRSSGLYFVMEYMRDGSLHDWLTAMAAKAKRGNTTVTTAAHGQGVDSPHKKRRRHHHDDRPDDITATSARSILRQVLLGLEYIHSRGHMHRDVKPENILMDGMVVKLADFSLTRPVVHVDDVVAPPPPRGRRRFDGNNDGANGGNNGDNLDGAHDSRRWCGRDNNGTTTVTAASNTTTTMTDYVATRWYRAPELVLACPSYTEAVDLFAVGCVAAEIFRVGEALFPGSSDEEQWRMQVGTLGGYVGDKGDNNNSSNINSNNNETAWWSSFERDWPEGYQQCLVRFPSFSPITACCGSVVADRLAVAIPHADPDAVAWICRLLQMSPHRRFTATEALADGYMMASVVAPSTISAVMRRADVGTAGLVAETTTVTPPFPIPAATAHPPPPPRHPGAVSTAAAAQRRRQRRREDLRPDPDRWQAAAPVSSPPPLLTRESGTMAVTAAAFVTTGRVASNTKVPQKQGMLMLSSLAVTVSPKTVPRPSGSSKRRGYARTTAFREKRPSDLPLVIVPHRRKMTVAVPTPLSSSSSSSWMMWDGPAAASRSPAPTVTTSVRILSPPADPSIAGTAVVVVRCIRRGISNLSQRRRDGNMNDNDDRRQLPCHLPGRRRPSDAFHID